MSYDHKICDLKYRINSLVPKNTCQKIIEIFEKYPEFHNAESSYKHETKEFKQDNFKCLNLSIISQPNKDIEYALNEAKKYISIMIINYVNYIRTNQISPTFDSINISKSDNIRILKYDVGQCIKDHTDINPNVRASCTLNLNENYLGGVFKFFDGKIIETFKTGDAMLFPAEPIWVHGTEPITKGTRYLINCFLKP